MAKVIIYGDSFTNANLLSVEVGTNCPQGGDSGHGGRTILRLRDDGGTAWSARVDESTFESPREIEIVLGGDCEAYTFLQALEFAVKSLRKRIDPHDQNVGTEVDVDFH